MKKIYSLLFTAIFAIGCFAQTFTTVGSNNGQGSFIISGNTYGPMVSNETAGVSWNRHAYIYPASLLSGIPSNSTIDSIFFSRVSSEGATQGMLTGTVNFKIYIKNTSAADFGAGDLNWPAEIATATLVYDADPTASVGNGPGYKKFILTAPFVYTGNNLEILVEYTQSAPATGEVGWGYDNDASVSAYLANSVKYISGTTGTPTNALNLSNLRHPGLAIFYTSNNPIDASTTSISFPEVSCYATPQDVSVVLTNAGNTTIASGDATVTLHIAGANTFTGTVANSSPILAGATQTLLFSGINLNNPGDNFDTAYVTLAGDPVPNNDTITTSSATASTITTFPATEDVEGSLPVFSYSTSIAGQSSWFINQGKYGNPDLSDSLAPHGGQQFFYFDGYEGDAGTVTRLFSNCLSLATGSPYSLTFWMSHDTSFSTSPDSLYVLVSTDEGQTWNRLLPGYSRYDPAFTVAGWKMQAIDLSAYAGQTIQLSFEGISEFGNIIGLDDITISATTTTPIVLDKFNVQRSGIFNDVLWSTNQENNTSHFIIQRSSESRNFQNIGQVKAAGNSNTTLHYRFADKSPATGINYYRLRIVDKDNTESFSAIKSVINSGFTVFVISPNPVLDELRANLDIEQPGKGMISITDISGKQVYNKTVSLARGNNALRLNIRQLQKGAYTIKIGLAKQTIVEKFTKF